MEIIKPKKLKQGDTIGILAVSGEIKDIDRIHNARWELFEDSRHCVFADQNEKYIKLLIEWLNKYD